MFERELMLYEFNLGLLEWMAADIPEKRMGERAGGVGHTPAWILGHLAIATDYAGMQFGLAKACPDAWHAAFAPGKPDDGATIPQKAQLLGAIRAGHARVAAACKTADPAMLNRPHDISYFAKTPVVTVADAIAALMVSHEAMHTGQLSAWRRQAGLPALF